VKLSSFPLLLVILFATQEPVANEETVGTESPAPATTTKQEAAPASSNRGRQLQGTVILRRNVPVVGANVLVRAEGTGSSFDLTATDAKGAFKVDSLPDGTYTVEVLRPGLKPITKQNVAIRAPFRAVVEVMMEPESGAAASTETRSADGAEPSSSGLIQVRGLVTTRDSGPKGEIRVRLVRPDGSEDPRAALTQPDGTFALEGLPAGPWRIEVLGAGYLPIRAKLYLGADSRVTATLVQQPANYKPAPEDLMPPEEPIPPPAG
jgi:hypothetical protein